MIRAETPLWEDQDKLWASYNEKIGSPTAGETCFLPDFFVIAPPKTGTTWLFENLRRHTEVFIPAEKEVRYFDLHWRHHNIRWYKQRFAKTTQRVAGDLSPTYSILPSFAIEFIHSIKPDLKLVFLIREPVDRAWSHTKHTFAYSEANFRSAMGRFDEVQDDELLASFTHDLILSSGDYEGILKRWLRYFPKQQFHVAFFEDVVANPERYLRSLFSFLCVRDAPDLSTFPLREKILEGLPHKPSPLARRLLESLYSKRRLALSSFLTETFGLTPPWPFSSEPSELAPICLLELLDDWKIYLFGGSFYALCSHTSPSSAQLRTLLVDSKAGVKSADFLGDLLEQVKREPATINGRFSTEDRRLIRVLNELSDSYKRRARIEPLENSRDFNIVRMGDKFLALAKSLGSTALMVERLGERELQPLILVGNSPDEVREKATAFERQNTFPNVRLIEETDDYNVAMAGDRFFGVAKKLGPVELFRERLGERELPPFILTAPDLSILRQRINKYVRASSDSRPLFSIIVPTRARPAKLRRFLDSLKATTARLDTIELILVIDADDKRTIEFNYNELPLKRVVVEPGLTMGALNMAGYEVATGDYIMLLNDDVIVRTENWDKKVLAAFKSFTDSIVLVHVNDKIFEEKLCTFPFLSREYCEIAGGICPKDYMRYRIDDHIYNVFNLLAMMGRLRILYLPDVVFEHTNYVLDTFRSPEYRPDERTHQIDTKRFDELLPERKQLALRLMDHIDRHTDSEKSRLREKLLEPVTDSVALRRHEYIRVQLDGKPLSSDDTRVTIGVVSADLRSDHTRACIDLLKKFTKNFDLVLLDNNRHATFNHAHEMNKLLSLCDTDFLVLMDDDVFVEPGWLDGMLRCMTPSVGVITPLHKNVSGDLSYAGVVMRPDYSGHHTHSLAVPELPTRIQTLCSAIMLIDLPKCGHIRFDESYAKYFLDIDYGFRIWRAGFEVVCSPYTNVTHVGGGTLQYGSSHSDELVTKDRQHYVKEWIDTRQYHDLEQGVWQTVPEIKALLDIPQELTELLAGRAKENPVPYNDRALAFFRFLKEYPALRDWGHQRVWHFVGNRRPSVDDPELGHLGFLLGCIQHPALVEENYSGLDIVLYDGEYYATPQTQGVFDYDRFIRGYYARSYRAERLDVLKARIDGGIQSVLPGKAEPNHGTGAVRLLLRELIKTWRMLKKERARFGSWKAAIRSVGKPILKRQVISLFGARTFFRLSEIYLQAKANKYDRGARLPVFWYAAKLVLSQGLHRLWANSRHLQSGFNNLTDTAAKHRRVTAERADPLRWLGASPMTLIDKDYRGYSIHRFEYKFFAVAHAVGSFSYEDFKRGKYDQCLIGHSLSEVHALVDQALPPTKSNQNSKVLVFACLPPKKLKPLLDRVYPGSSITVLVGKAHQEAWGNYETVSVEQDSLDEWAHAQNSSASDRLCERLINENFDRITVPWSFPETWNDNSLEMAASKHSKRVEILHSSGERRLYQGENLHRLAYNKAYLASMFQVIPSPQGRTVLEAGCSDGLVCDIFALAGAAKVVGIDVMKTVGCGFRYDGIDYRVMDVDRINFPDQSFDITYSIATFEHLAKPYVALLEMVRVTKIGGYVYIQAGPLYYSPFGHHMFGYFQDYPWIHLRKSKDEIIAHAKERRIDQSIERDLAMTCEQYVTGMLNTDHVNGLLLEDYRLQEFTERDDVEILKFNVSYEGAELLTPEIAAELPQINTDRLIEHGFEIAFRRIN